MKIVRFEDLIIWQEARSLSQTVYKATRSEAFRADYRFVSQITASAGSIMDNIAEGFERNGNKEFLQFLFIAKGSCGELQSQLYRAYDCNYITKEDLDIFLHHAKTVSTKINNFIIYLKNSNLEGTKKLPPKNQ